MKKKPKHVHRWEWVGDAMGWRVVKCKDKKCSAAITMYGAILRLNRYEQEKAKARKGKK